MRKAFDKSLYEANDKLARESVKRLFKNSEFEIRDNEKVRGVDLLVYDKNGNHILNIETEIKRVWNGKDFPYTSVQIPERKNKYMILDKPTYLIMFNSNQSAYAVVKGKDIINSPLVIVPNKYISYGEKFYQVPVEKVDFNNVTSIKGEK